MFKDKSAERLKACMENIPFEILPSIEEITVSWKEHPDLRCASLWPEINIKFKKEK